MINYDNIPEELRQLRQWVCANANSKIPMQATCIYPASSTNPATWSSFEDAVSAVMNGWYDYIGFVFADNGIVGIDIDEGFTPEGYVSPLAIDVVNKCCSYTEQSRSKRGFHIFVKGLIGLHGS